MPLETASMVPCWHIRLKMKVSLIPHSVIPPFPYHQGSYVRRVWWAGSVTLTTTVCLQWCIPTL